MFGKPHITEYQDWILVQASAQGDLGIWELVKKYKDNKASVVLYCEWEFHSDLVYCGNVSVSGSEFCKIINSQ